MSLLVKSWGNIVSSFLGKGKVGSGAADVASSTALAVVSSNTSPGGRKRPSSGESGGAAAGKIDSRAMVVRIADMLAHSSSTSSGFEVSMEDAAASASSPSSGGWGGAKLSTS